MAEFRVTRPIVQEMAEMGAIQPAGLAGVIGSDFDIDKIVSRMGFANFGRYDVKPSSILRLNSVVTDILTLSEGRPVSDLEIFIDKNSGQADLHRKLEEGDFHEDLELEDGILTVLFTPNPTTDRRLIVGGRGNSPDIDQQFQLPYSKGEILLAGEGFGRAILPGDFGGHATWHGATGSAETVVSISYLPLYFDS